MESQKPVYNKKIMADKIKDKLFSSMVRTRSKFNVEHRKSSLNPNYSLKSGACQAAVRKTSAFASESRGEKSKLEYELRILVGHAMVLDRLIEEIDREDVVCDKNSMEIEPSEREENDSFDTITLVEEERMEVSEKLHTMDVSEEEDEDEVATINYEVNAFDGSDEEEEEEEEEEESFFTQGDIMELNNRNRSNHSKLNDCRVYSMHNNSTNDLNLVLA